jgi:hypothetical protein
MLLTVLSALPWFWVDTSLVSFSLPWGGVWRVPQVLLVQSWGALAGGALIAAVGPCQLRLMALLSNPTGRTMAMAVHWSVIGVIASLGSLCGGWMMDFFNARPPLCTLPNGMPFSFFHAIIITFALVVAGGAVPLMLKIRTPVDRVPFREALSFFILSPFNAVRNLAKF